MAQTEQYIGIFTTDNSLKIRSWDSWLVEVTGLSSEIVKGIHLLEIFPNLITQGLDCCFDKVLRTGQVEKLAFTTHSYLIPCVPRIYSKYFEYMQQHVVIAPLREREKIIGTIVTIEDITPQLEREQELGELAEQLKSTDESMRLRAAQTLATKKDDFKDTEKLLQALGDKSWRVRQVAVETLAERGDPNAVSTLVNKIRNEHRDISVLNSVLKVLTQMQGDIVTPLTELLQIPDEDLRGYVTLALGEQGDRRAIPILMRALEDDNQNVRYNAIEALGKLGAVEATPMLLAITLSGDFFLAFPALDALRKIGDFGIIHSILPLLNDELLCEPVIETLGQLGDETTIPPLVNLLNQPNTPLLSAAQAIAALYDRYTEFFDEGNKIREIVQLTINTQGIQNLLHALENSPQQYLRALVIILGWLEGPEVEQALTHLLGNASAQKEVIKALVRYGPRIGELLIEQLNIRDFEARQAAIGALERIGEVRAVPALIRILNEEDNEELIISTANALTKIGDRQGFEALVNFLGHPNSAVRQAIIAALNALNHPKMAEKALILLKNPNPLVRESAIKIIGYVGYSNSPVLLKQCCLDEDENVRQAAVESLPNFKVDSLTLSLLADLLNKDTPRIRCSVIRSLGEIEIPAVIPLLQKSLDDEDAWVRYFAVRALGQQQASTALDDLLKMAQTDAAHHVRIAAVEALGLLNESEAIPLLKLLTKVEEEDLALAAISSLGHLKHPKSMEVLLGLLSTALLLKRKMVVVEALAEHPELEVIHALQRLAATEKEASLVDLAMDKLVQIATEPAVLALIALIGQSSKRESIIKALAECSGKEQIEWIAKGLFHESVNIRAAIVEVLARIKSQHAINALVPALSDKEAVIRLATITTLGQLAPEIALPTNDPNLAVRRAAQSVLERA